MSRSILCRARTWFVLGPRVVVLFSLVEVGLRLTSLTRLCSVLGVDLQSAADGGGPAEPLPAATTMRSVRAVSAVSERWPFGDTCLRRCLVLGRLLRRARPVVVLGVRRGEDGQIAAHSWIEVGGLSIDPLSEKYVELRR